MDEKSSLLSPKLVRTFLLLGDYILYAILYHQWITNTEINWLNKHFIHVLLNSGSSL